MEELKIVGVEHETLLMSSEDGTGYRVRVDEGTLARLHRPVAPPEGRRVAPREIQAQIRAGLSAEDVASVTGADLEYVRRFEGPVLAEREFVVESALSVPVRAVEDDPLAESTVFGDVIRTRLAEAGATDERWASWKEPAGGWIVKLTFEVDSVEHDARWGFEPKKQALSPLNQEATGLSQQGDLPVPLIPRLRAVPLADTVPDPTHARFDSGAFESVGESATEHPAGRASRTAVGPEAGTGPSQQTADLLEALRRRRGEREPLDFDALAQEEEQSSEGEPSGVIRIVEVQVDAMEAATPTKPVPAAKGGARKGRASMPSWDDIVFGARPDDA